MWLRYLAAGADRFVEPDPELRELQDVVRGLVRQLASAPPQVVGGGRVTPGLVHDFNNYLLALEVVLEMLERSPGDRQLWTEARAALEQAVCLMGMLLGQVHADRARAVPVDLGAIVRSAVSIARHLVAPGIEVTAEIGGPLPRVLGVVSELERMALALVLSASEAMRDGGEVRVVVTRSSDAVLLAVTNAGAGPRGPRDGLDLDVARAIIKRHRGTFLVATCEPGSSSVLVTLPFPAQCSC